MSNKLKEEWYSVGDTVGYLTLIERDSEEERKHKSGIYWKCRCKCGNIVTKSESSLLNKKVLMIRSCGCSKEMNPDVSTFEDRSKAENKIEWDELYEYVKYKVLGYNKDEDLTNNTVLRLKGLRTVSFMENNKTKNKNGYSYAVILATFKYCSIDIQRALARKTFKNESSRVNYICKIVENNLHTVYKRIEDTKRANERLQNSDMSQTVTDISSLYIGGTSNKKNNGKFDDMW